MSKQYNFFGVSVLVALSIGVDISAAGSQSNDTQLEAKIAQAFEDKRAEWSGLTFSEFERTVYKEPIEGGVYIVNGDTPIRNIKLLKEFYDTKVNIEPPVCTKKYKKPEFILLSVGGHDAVWSADKKNSLSYCVSNSFGDRHDMVVKAMEAATHDWETYADINFIHKEEQDENCDENNQAVVFDVRPVDVRDEYLARAFFPNDPRWSRNILIDNSSFRISKEGGTLNLTGILRHELGHVIGARHEHTRPQAGGCFEDFDYNIVTGYDPGSAMHYPQCNGLGDWSLTLTNFDKNGVACTYGAKAPFTIDPSICSPTTSLILVNTEKSKQVDVVHTDQTVNEGEEIQYGDYFVKPGTKLIAEITGPSQLTGDADLYLSFDESPQHTPPVYHCRPFRTDSNEKCELIVPPNATIARIMVRGHKAAEFDLKLRYHKS